MPQLSTLDKMVSRAHLLLVLAVALVALAALGAGAGAAYAGTLSVAKDPDTAGWHVVFTGDDTANYVAVSVVGSNPASVSYNDVYETITPVSPCVQGGDTHTASCPVTFADPADSSVTDQITGLEAYLLDGYDLLEYGASTQTFLAAAADGTRAYGGGLGDTIGDSYANDVVYGGDDGGDLVYAGVGNDTVYGEAGADKLYDSGGPGTTTLIGGVGYDNIYAPATDDGLDVYDGGADDDGISYELRSAPLTIDLVAQTAAEDSLTSFENAEGGSGSDVITGTSGENWLSGNGGTDVISAGDGNDHVDVYDSDSDTLDTVDCGAGNDYANADTGEQTTGCETVWRPCGVRSDPNPGGTCGSTNTGGSTDTSGSGDTTTPTGTTPTGTAPTDGGSTTVFTPLTAAGGTGDTSTALPSAGTVFAPTTQFSPQLDTVTGSVAVTQDNSTVEADLLFNGSLAAKVTVVGKMVKKGVKKGMLAFKVKLTKNARKAFKKKKAVKVTLKTIVTPPGGKAVIKTRKIVMKRGKPKSRCASAIAHSAC